MDVPWAIPQWRTLDSSKSETGLRGWVTNFEEACSVLKQFESAKSQHFIGNKKTPHFGSHKLTAACSGASTKVCADESPSSETAFSSYLIRFSDENQQVVPFDGVPFITTGSYTLECLYGRNKQKCTQEKEKEEIEEEVQTNYPIPHKRKKMTQCSKKKRCPATVLMKEIIRFPHFKATSQSKRARSDASWALREAIRSGTEVVTEHRICIAFPSDQDHQDTHPIGMLTGFFNPINEKVKDKLEELVRHGVTTVSEARQHLNIFIETVLFPNPKSRPNPSDTACYPPDHVIRNHIYEALKKLRIYLDYNATTPVEPTVIEAISGALTDAWGNPSSAYPQGQLAKQVIDKARSQVAEMVGASSRDIIFTSGGTEANNLVIHTAIEYFREISQNASCDKGELQKPHIITSNLEHDSIKLPLEHLLQKGVADVTFVEASTKTGRVEAESVLDAIRPTTCLVTIMHANNETGVIQPVEEIFRRVRRLPHNPSHRVPRILLHTDAAQTIGKIKVDVESLNTDYLTIVGHKFYAPRIGALYIRGGGDGKVPLHPLLFGGGQERNLRPGTENTGMIAGLGKAAELVIKNIGEYESHMRKVRDYLESSLQRSFPGRVRINGKLEGSERIPNTCNVSILGPNRQGRKILSKVTRLQASVGAACHSHAGDRPSHILLAIGVPCDVAMNALRLSVGRGTTLSDIDVVVKDLKAALHILEEEANS